MADRMKSVDKEDVMERFGKLTIPFLIAAVVIALLYFVVEPKSSGKLFLLMMAYFFPPLGKESIIPIGVAGGEIYIPILNQHAVVPAINPFVMAMTIAFVDIIVALFLLWNYDLAKKIPFVGKFMGKVEKIGQKSSSKYSWLKPLRFVGIMLFVMVPFQGSGGLVGSIVGRLIGMKPLNTFFAISIGAIVGCLIIAYFADFITSVLIQNFLLGIMIIIVLVVIGLMIYVYKKNKKNNA